MDLLIFLLITALAAAYWMSGMRARELALSAARSACTRENVQLLDESVVLIRVRPALDGRGNPCWRRLYRFEFSDDGGSRRDGQVELLGARPVAMHLALAPYTLHELH